MQLPIRTGMRRKTLDNADLISADPIVGKSCEAILRYLVGLYNDQLS